MLAMNSSYTPFPDPSRLNCCRSKQSTARPTSPLSRPPSCAQQKRSAADQSSPPPGPPAPSCGRPPAHNRKRLLFTYRAGEEHVQGDEAAAAAHSHLRHAAADLMRRLPQT
eukprot:6179941-Pyramimonas_sp.AAC.1